MSDERRIEQRPEAQDEEAPPGVRTMAVVRWAIAGTAHARSTKARKGRLRMRPSWRDGEPLRRGAGTHIDLDVLVAMG